MKKVLIVLFGCTLSVPLMASTCETRVDQKWDKSTQERIISCLNPEAYQAPAQPELIVDQIYSIHLNKPKQQTQQTQYIYKQYKPQITYNEYINDDHYPKFRNEFWPTQSVELAHETALDALQAERDAALAVTLPDLKSNKKPRKPNRQVITSTVETRTTTVTTSMPAATIPQEQILLTPSSSEVDQAQALQNDSLNTSYGTSSSYTDQFLDDEILGPADFGYNDTDPTFAQ